MVTATEKKRLELYWQGVLKVLVEEPFRGLSVEDIVRTLDDQADPPGIVEVRAAVDWLVRQGLAVEDKDAPAAPRYHATRKYPPQK
jgi:Fe2+ or Zn2+ uptake regulation protein